MTSDVVLVLTTVPNTELGEVIARAIVEERLAACANVLAPMTSFYRWKGRVEREVEHQLIIKTTAALVDRLRARVTTLHSYDLPEFIVISVAGGAPAYLDWIRESADGRDNDG